jgi:hypothetical protein
MGINSYGYDYPIRPVSRQREEVILSLAMPGATWQEDDE